MGSHYEVDVERMSRIIHSCEILLIRFDLVPKRLFIDLRSNENEGPLITLLDPVRSPKERLRQIRALRPEFGDPGGVRILRWPRYVASLERLGCGINSKIAVDSRAIPIWIRGSTRSTTACVRKSGKR